MKILIAGATGFVGTYLIDYLLEKGYSINALSRKLIFLLNLIL